MRVRALTNGFDGSLRRPGDEFDAPEGAHASWYVPVDEVGPSKPAAKPKKAELRTLSELGKAAPAGPADTDLA